MIEQAVDPEEAQAQSKKPQGNRLEDRTDRKVAFQRSPLALSLSSTDQFHGPFLRARLNGDFRVKFGSSGEVELRYNTMSQVNGLGSVADPTHFGIHRFILGSSKSRNVSGLVELRTNEGGLLSGPRIGVYIENIPEYLGLKPVFLTLAYGKRRSDPHYEANANVLGSVVLIARTFHHAKDLKIEILNDLQLPISNFKSAKSKRVDDHIEVTLISPKIFSAGKMNMKFFASAQRDIGSPKGNSILYGVRLELK